MTHGMQGSTLEYPCRLRRIGRHAVLPGLSGAAQLRATLNTFEQAAGLKHVMAADGVHFTPHGYEKIADTVVKVCKTHLEKLDTAASLVSAGPVNVKPKTFYWRGFVSPVGSLRPSAHASAYKAAHPGGGGKWRAKPTNVGKNATTPSGGRTAPPYYRRN